MKLRAFYFALLCTVAFLGCSKDSGSMNAVNDYFSALQKHDSVLYLRSLSLQEQHAWQAPSSSARVTFMVLQHVSFHYRILSDSIKNDSIQNVEVVFDSTSDPRLHSLPIGVKQQLRVSLNPENGEWKVRGVSKT